MGYAIAAATIFFIHGSYSHRFLQTKTQVDMLLNKEISTNKLATEVQFVQEGAQVR